MKSLILACAVVLVAVPAMAQAAITSYQVQYFQVGTDPVIGAPFQVSGQLPVSSITCNLTPVVLPNPSPTIINPTRIQWDDPVNVGRACVAMAGSVGLLALPVGMNYFATMTSMDNASFVTDRSGASNVFVLQAKSNAPTGVRILP